MRKLIMLLAVLAVIAALLLGPRSPDQEAPSATKAQRPSGTHQPMPRRYQASPPTPEAQEPQSEPEVELRRVVRFSSRDRREEESDLQYKHRMNWLNGFIAFERRAQMTSEQRERLISVLADAQQQAVLGWNAYIAAVRDPRRERYSLEGVPRLATLNKSMRLEILPKLREFLNHEPMVSFRRSAGLSDPFGTARTQPLDISSEPASSARSFVVE